MKRRSQRIAAIDIGSNTVHMVIMDQTTSKLPTHLSSDSVILQLGALITKQRTLPPKVYRKLRRTLNHFVHRAAKANAENVLIVATQAMRELRQGPQLLARLSKDVGVPVHMISSDQEAKLGYLGVKSELRSRESQLIIDSGGASTELTLTTGLTPIARASIPLGAAVLSTHLHNDPPEAFEVVRLMIPIIKALNQAPTSKPPVSALLTGGTAHHLLAVAKANPSRLSRHDLQKAMRRLLRHPAKKIAKKFDMEVERAHLLVPGALLLTALLDHYALDHLRITARGLRDGMVMAFARNKSGWWR
jgi:exopolyphosphatase / guanosine-5'-triphosphate,3'-diphosphate pyrophosphatase